MKYPVRKKQKSYAMLRMVEAIGRAIRAQSVAEKDKAARWAAAWGLLGGIRTRGIRLRRNSLFDISQERRRTPRGS